MNTKEKLEAAQKKLKAADATQRDAQAQLETALATLKAEGSDRARNAVLKVEDHLRLASTERTWAAEALETVQLEDAQAEHAAKLADHERADQACNADAFRQQAGPIVQRLAKLAREQAELLARGAALSATFTSARTALASSSREVGLQPAPVPEFDKIMAAETALARGSTPAEVLSLHYGVEPTPGVEPAEQLGLVFRGQNPREVTALLAQLREAETRRGHAVRKVLKEGSGFGSNASPTPLESFQDVSADCAQYRARLEVLGFGEAAGRVRSDDLADELSSVDTQRAALIVDKHRSADYMRATEAQQRRDTKAHEAECKALKAALAELGCAKIAAALPRLSFGGGTTAGANAFAAY